MKKLYSIILTFCIAIILVPANCASAEIGDYYYEDFEGYGENASLSGTISGDVHVKSMGGVLGKAAMIGSGNGRWLATLPSSISGDIAIEVDFMQSTKGRIYSIFTPQSAGSSGSGYNTPNYPFELASDGTNITIVHGVKNGTSRKVSSLIPNYVAGRTYSLRFEISTTTKNVRAWVDGTEVLTTEEKIFSGSDVPHIVRFDAQMGGGSEPYYLGRVRVANCVNAGVLKGQIDEAQKLLYEASIGFEAGQYPQQARDAFEAAIDKAIQIYNEQMITPNEQVISVAISELEKATQIFQASVITKSLSSLQSDIANAKLLLYNSEYGEEFGQYPQEAKTALEKAVAEAEFALECLQSSYDPVLLEQACENLSKAVFVFGEARIGDSMDMYTEDFEAGAIPQPWSVIYGAPTVVSVGENKALRFAAGSTHDRAVAYFTDMALNGLVTLEFSYMPEVAVTTVHQIIEVTSAPYNTDNMAFVLSSDVSNILIQTASGQEVLVCGYEKDAWYNFKFVLDFKKDSIEAYVNGEQALGGTKRGFIGKSVTGLERLNTYMMSSNSGSFLLDNFRISVNLLKDLEQAAEEIIGNLGNVSGVFENINLPTSYGDRLSLKWESSDPSVLSSSGAVRRPLGENAEVELKLTVNNGGYKIRRVIPVTILKRHLGEVIDENFSNGVFPSGWMGSALIIGSEKYLEVSSEIKAPANSKQLSPAARLGFCWMQPIKVPVDKMVALEKAGEIQCYLSSDGNDIKFYHGKATQGITVVPDYEAGRWYSIGIDMDAVVGKAVLTLDGKRLEDCAFTYLTDSGCVDALLLSATASNKFYVDDVVLGDVVPTRITITPSVEETLCPANAEIKIPYALEANDARDNWLLTDSLVLTASNKAGKKAEGIDFLNGNIIVAPKADTGEITLQASAPDGSCSGSAILKVNKQNAKTIRINGPQKITDAGKYQYVAELISDSGMIIQPDTIRWSVRGDGATIDETSGFLIVSSSLRGKLNITVVADGISQSLDVSVNTKSGGSSGDGDGRGNGSGVILTPSTPTSSSQISPEKKFYDLEVASWAEEPIMDMVERGILKGVSETEFCPNNPVTRAQFAAILVRAFRLNVGRSQLPFYDVDTSDWCYGEISAAYECGIINGLSNGSFLPNAPVCREDVAVMLHRTLQYLGTSWGASSETVNFEDEDLFSPYARDAVCALANLNIINGREDGSFDAKGITTRAEASALVYRILTRMEGER